MPRRTGRPPAEPGRTGQLYNSAGCGPSHEIEERYLRSPGLVVERLRAKPGGESIPVVIGDMADVPVSGPFPTSRCTSGPDRTAPGPPAKLCPVPAQLITMVALYGIKTGDLKRLLETVQAILGERLRGGFQPYSLDQIHGTVIRLDGVADAQSGLIINPRYAEFTGMPHGMDHARALEIVTAHLTPPLSIRIGGYGPATPATFSSRGQHPYERMFSGPGNAFVLMGWPAATVAQGISARPLDRLRRTMNEANIVHWYHDSPTGIDNDFHLVVGHHDGVSPAEAAAAVDAVRTYLAQHPVQIDVGVDQVSIIAADSPTLAPAQFVAPLPVDPGDIAKLYR